MKSISISLYTAMTMTGKLKYYVNMLRKVSCRKSETFLCKALEQPRSKEREREKKKKRSRRQRKERKCRSKKRVALPQIWPPYSEKECHGEWEGAGAACPGKQSQSRNTPTEQDRVWWSCWKRACKADRVPPQSSFYFHIIHLHVYNAISLSFINTITF